MLDKILTTLFGSQNERDVKKLRPLLLKVNEKESWASSLSEEDFKKENDRLKDAVQSGKATLDDILPEAFALSREAARRVLGERAYDVQILGSLVLHSGRITEMKTGEGKTLMCVAASYLNSLSGKGVHIVTVNDYLAARDAEWMRGVYSYLGQTVGVILPSMDNDAKRKAYEADITYGTNSEFGFDYLRDNMQIDLSLKVQRGFNFCIVDEIDSILIDEARTPLIISGQAEDDTEKFEIANRFVGMLDEVEKDPKTGDYPDEVDLEADDRKKIKGDYKLDEKSKRVSFTDAGINKIGEILERNGIINGSLVSSENFEFVHYFTQALRAHHLYKNEVDYIVRDGEVEIVDEFTGRVLEGRRYGEGLHQAIEAKEGVKVALRSRTLATVTYQNFFRMYKKLSGMTGTAATEAVEFNKIYNLDVVSIPTNKPVIRVDENDEVYLNENAKWNAIAKEVEAAHKSGQPVLLGTVSVEKSEHISSILTRRGIRHEVLNAKNHAREALIIAEAGAKGSVTIATNMAGRGTDIKLGGNAEFRARRRVGEDVDEEVYKSALAEEKAKCEKDSEEVKKAGGLYVIGSERHESRRIDNQLRGRSGRQGDPGRSKFFISMDDDLMRLFGGERMKKMLRRMGMNDNEAIDHPWLNRGIKKAQQKVEDRNFEIRKHLLDYDDVLNEQRNVIYKQRDEILADEDLSMRVMDNARDIVEEIFENYFSSKKNASHLSEEGAGRLADIFGISSEEEIASAKNSLEYLERDIKEKIALIGKEQFNMFIRYQYIQLIDKGWLDQLETLEGLRDAVALRSYGSKNPLTEYKIDGFNIFDEMLESIKLEVLRRVFRSRFEVKNENSPKLKMQAKNMEARHEEAPSFIGDESRREASRNAIINRENKKGVTVRRSVPKVGRNEACPCGSGKKYKQCHGRGV